MPKAPIWEAEVGACRVEEYHTNDRGTHFEIRIGNGHQVVLFPHEIPRLRALLDRMEQHTAMPALVPGERRRA